MGISFPLVAKDVCQDPTKDGASDGSSRYQVTLERIGSGNAVEKLGLRLAFKPEHANLPVLGITGGLAERWNEKCAPAVRIQIGDIVVEVNGVKSNAIKMMELCLNARVLKVTLRGGQLTEELKAFNDGGKNQLENVCYSWTCNRGLCSV